MGFSVHLSAQRLLGRNLRIRTRLSEQQQLTSEKFLISLHMKHLRQQSQVNLTDGMRHLHILNPARRILKQILLPRIQLFMEISELQRYLKIHVTGTLQELPRQDHLHLTTGLQTLVMKTRPSLSLFLQVMQLMNSHLQ